MVIRFSFFASEKGPGWLQGAKASRAAVGRGRGARELLPPCVGTVTGGCWEGRAEATGPPPAPAPTRLLWANLPERLPRPSPKLGAARAGWGPRSCSHGRRQLGSESI